MLAARGTASTSTAMATGLAASSGGPFCEDSDWSYPHGMSLLRFFVGAGFAVVGAVSLAGCSADIVIWGSEGAQVIESTETLIRDIAADGTSELVCEGAEVELGTADDWAGRSAGEPEAFTPEVWEEQATLDPQWSINIEGLPAGVAQGDEFPGDVFYRETSEGYCVVDVAWSTLVSAR